MGALRAPWFRCGSVWRSPRMADSYSGHYKPCMATRDEADFEETETLCQPQCMAENDCQASESVAAQARRVERHSCLDRARTGGRTRNCPQRRLQD